MKLALALLVLAAACATNRPHFHWTSQAGRDCFWNCQMVANTCNISCRNLICVSHCRDQGDDCKASCPDITAEMGQ